MFIAISSGINFRKDTALGETHGEGDQSAEVERISLRFSRNFREAVMAVNLSITFDLVSTWWQHATTQQIKTRAPVHLAFDRLEPIHMTFSWSITP